MKEATKCLITNEMSQDRFIRLKDTANHSVAKISNEALQERSIRLENTAKKSIETSPKKASRLEKHDFESPESQPHRQEEIIKRISLTTANETVDQQNKRLKTYRETQQLVRVNVEIFDPDFYVFAETICKVCSKRCYPNQCAKSNLSNCGFLSYLPQKLSTKDVLVLCHRCKTHLSSKKRSSKRCHDCTISSKI
jgi:hypothetical protein